LICHWLQAQLLIAETDHGPPDQPVPAMAAGVRRGASGRITDTQLS
jgi:hypothetical protein